MKKYEKPMVEKIVLGVADCVLQETSSTSMGMFDNNEYDPGIGQISLRRRVYIEDDWEDDEPDYGW